MRQFFALLLLLTLTSISGPVAAADLCATIPGGAITTAANEPVETGYDAWGYNYQARIFNGTYCNAYRNASWCQPYAADDLEMKWNDAWLSNVDCDGDGLLDRHFGFASYRGSGAWLTNHQKGTYLDANNKKQRWSYFVKIVAAPADAVLTGGTWFAADGSELGPAIWNEFAVIQEVANDTGTGEHGIAYLSPFKAGLGGFGPH